MGKRVSNGSAGKAKAAKTNQKGAPEVSPLPHVKRITEWPIGCKLLIVMFPFKVSVVETNTLNS